MLPNPAMATDGAADGGPVRLPVAVRLVLLYGVLYALGFALKPWPNAPAVLWPSYAVSGLAFFLTPYRLWPAVALAVTACEFLGYPLVAQVAVGAHRAPEAMLGLIGANVLCSALPVALGRSLGFRRSERRRVPRAPALWLLALVIGVLPGAIAGAWVHSHLAGAGLALEPVAVWAASAVLGMVTFGPAVAALVLPAPAGAAAPGGRAELAAAALMTLALAAWLLWTPSATPGRYAPHVFFCIPLVWLALRFGRGPVTLGVLVATLTVCIGAARGLGAFSGANTPLAWGALLVPTQLLLIIIGGGAHLINLLTLRQLALLGELGRSNERLRGYAHELDLTEERARRAIAADLHDGVGQTLAGQAMLLGALKPLVPQGSAQRFLDDALSAAQEAQVGIRTMIQDLSPPELGESSVSAVLRGLARFFAARYGFEVGVQVSGEAAIDDERLRVIYRVVRELLFNAYRHARVARAEIIVDQFAEHIDIAVVDRGAGFDPAERRARGAGSFGLQHLTERLAAIGGTFELDTAPGAGCRANVRVPLAPRAR